MRVGLVGVVTITLFGATSTAAQEAKLLGGGELDLRFPSDGATQELSAYLEVEEAGLYGGFQGLVTNDATAAEISLYAGYRAELANGVSYDLSYTRYFYPNDGGDCCGELGLTLGTTVGDRVGDRVGLTTDLTFDVTFDPAASLGSVELGADYLVTDRVLLSANYGLFQHAEDPTETTWDLGLGYGASDETEVELRYYDGSEEDGHIGLFVTFDTELLSF